MIQFMWIIVLPTLNVDSVEANLFVWTQNSGIVAYLDANLGVSVKANLLMGTEYLDNIAYLCFYTKQTQSIFHVTLEANLFGNC